MSRAEDRVGEVLKTLVEQYINEGQPIASKAVAQMLSCPVSSATVRNVMALLEDQGLIVSPHTSAGRVPTQAGYRMFVDRLITMTPLDPVKTALVKQELRPEKSPHELVEAASHVLSELTSMAGIVLAPQQERSLLRQVEFLPLQGGRALVILVLNEKDVQNRIIQLDRDYTDVELQQAANFLNAHFVGVELTQIRGRLLQQMRGDKDRMDSLMQSAIQVASQAFESLDEEGVERDCVVSGQSNLLDMVQGDVCVDQLKQLFEAFQQKRQLLGIIDRCVRADGVQIFIGPEAGNHLLDECSMVTAAYQSSRHELLGVLAVIGPTRMPYQKVIPMVDMTAKILSAALNPLK